LSGRVPVAPVNDIRQALESPFVAERKGVAEYEYPDGRKARMMEGPIRYGEEPPRRAAPALGADTDALLAEIGYDAARIKGLRDNGVVG
jgi:crotonobetainyl-CoA:carnitine CoA-transferase CaiB-like acyl-CoA transferase